MWRILKRNGLITPQPQKRPRSSFIRFVAKLPNETWQVDATPWQLADGRPVEILNFEDDHSRLFLASLAFPTVRAGFFCKQPSPSLFSRKVPHSVAWA